VLHGGGAEAGQMSHRRIRATARALCRRRRRGAGVPGDADLLAEFDAHVDVPGEVLEDAEVRGDLAHFRGGRDRACCNTERRKVVTSER
jgi:hypothetical protein